MHTPYVQWVYSGPNQDHANSSPPLSFTPIHLPQRLVAKSHADHAVHRERKAAHQHGVVWIKDKRASVCLLIPKMSAKAVLGEIIALCHLGYNSRRSQSHGYFGRAKPHEQDSGASSCCAEEAGSRDCPSKQSKSSKAYINSKSVRIGLPFHVPNKPFLFQSEMFRAKFTKAKFEHVQR